uniref:(northern house mosquito) hypothetical protein n=1 Tax=Culex pipiens TaxID=7175 RepID=A0A8D8JRM8_CULPI
MESRCQEPYWREDAAVQLDCYPLQGVPPSQVEQGSGGHLRAQERTDHAECHAYGRSGAGNQLDPERYRGASRQLHPDEDGDPGARVQPQADHVHAVHCRRSSLRHR